MTAPMAILAVLLALWAPLPAPAGEQPAISFRVPAPLREQLSGDLVFLRALRGAGASALFQLTFGAEFSGAAVADYLASRVSSIDMDDCDGNSATVACVIYALNPHVIWLTDSYAKFSMPQVFRLSTLVHEARHSEAAYRYHALCPTPFLDENGREILGRFTGTRLEGLRACDDSALGAYGVQAEFLGNARSRCTNCSEKVKLDAEIFGNDLLPRIVSPAERQRLSRDLRQVN